MLENIVSAAAEHNMMMEKFVDACHDSIEALGKAIVRALKDGGKILIFGNGGSAADAQHFAAELVGTFEDKKRRALPALALSVNTSCLTSIGNDFTFEHVFARQVEALAEPKDLCIGISTSGRSPNIFQALLAAKKRGCPTAALLGGSGGSIKEIADIPLIAPSSCTPRIQEAHILIIHILCGMVDAAFGEKPAA